MRAFYRPAATDGWFALCGPSCALLLGGTLDQAEIDSVWSAIAEAKAATSVLAVLANGGLEDLRPFALVQFEEAGARVFVHGDVRARVSLPSGEEVLAGTGLSSWSERLVEDARLVSIEVGEAERGPDDVHLPLGIGVAMASALELSALGSPAGWSASVAIDDDEVFSETVIVTSGDHQGNTLPTDIVKLLREERRARRLRAQGDALRPILVLPDGTTAPLDGRAIVGRAPQAMAADVDEQPRLVAIATASQLSRNHVEFSVEDGIVLIRDLDSRNGTVVVLPGRKPRWLVPGEPTPILIGTIVDFGSGTAITLEER